MGHGKIVLLGTLHLNRELATGLLDHLENISPDVITVEISRFSLRFRNRALPVWLTVLCRNLRTLPARRRGHAGIRLLLRQLRMPYEWTAAKNYALRKGIRCIAVDTGKFARLELPAWHCELLNCKNLRIISSEPDFELEPYFSARQRFARRFLEEGQRCCEAAHPLSYLMQRQWQERERIVARRLEKVSAVSRLTVHVCGWTHLVMASPWQSLADMLSHLEIQRILVN